MRAVVAAALRARAHLLMSHPQASPVLARKQMTQSQFSYLPGGAGQVTLRPGDVAWADFLAAGEDAAARGFEPHVADPDDVTNVLFSSGTTGAELKPFVQCASKHTLRHATCDKKNTHTRDM